MPRIRAEIRSRIFLSPGLDVQEGVRALAREHWSLEALAHGEGAVEFVAPGATLPFGRDEAIRRGMDFLP